MLGHAKLLIGISGLALCASASAVPTYHFTAVLDSNSGSPPELVAFFPAGSVLSGTFTPATDSDSNPAPDRGFYVPAPANTLTGAYVSSSPSGGFGSVVVDNDTFAGDFFSTLGPLAGAGFPDWEADSLVLIMGDPTGVVFSGDALPTAFDLTDWTQKEVSLGFSGIGSNAGEAGFVTFILTELTVTTVPEPATLTLLGIALAGLGFGRRGTLH